jgi:hypothetical protein
MRDRSYFPGEALARTTTVATGRYWHFRMLKSAAGRQVPLAQLAFWRQ